MESHKKNKPMKSSKTETSSLKLFSRDTLRGNNNNIYATNNEMIEALIMGVNCKLTMKFGHRNYAKKRKKIHFNFKNNFRQDITRAPFYYLK